MRTGSQPRPSFWRVVLCVNWNGRIAHSAALAGGSTRRLRRPELCRRAGGIPASGGRYRASLEDTPPLRFGAEMGGRKR